MGCVEDDHDCATIDARRRAVAICEVQLFMMRQSAENDLFTGNWKTVR